MSWFYLTIAGVLEIGWIISLKYTQGFTRPVPVVFYALFGAGSAWFLSLAMRTLPMALSYVIWMGIGLVGASIYGAFFFDEPLNRLKVASMILIVAGIVGLKVAAGSAQPHAATTDPATLDRSGPRAALEATTDEG